MDMTATDAKLRVIPHRGLTKSEENIPNKYML